MARSFASCSLIWIYCCKSLLQPISTLAIFSWQFSFILSTHFCTFLKDFLSVRSKHMMTAWARLKNYTARLKFFSCPAVSHMYSLTCSLFLPCYAVVDFITLTKSTPKVAIYWSLKPLPEYILVSYVLPTLLSPINITFISFACAGASTISIRIYKELFNQF